MFGKKVDPKKVWQRATRDTVQRVLTSKLGARVAQQLTSILGLPRGKWVTIGYCGVDSGMLMITDPCYVLQHQPSFPGEKVGKALGWEEFLEKVDATRVPPGFSSFSPRDKAAAVAFRSGLGDGLYEVRALIKDYGPGWGKRIAEVRVLLA